MRLFDGERDVRLVLKWKEIFDNIENAVDRCADVTDVIEGVVIENL